MTDPNDLDSPPARARSGRLGRAAIAVVLALVLTLIAIGIVRIASAGGDDIETPRSAHSPSESSVGAPPSYEYAPPRHSTVAFVDIRTGRTTPLPDSILAMEGMTHVQASADSTMLAFETDPGVFVAEADGSDIRQPGPAAWGGAAPTWSPDGTKIAFSSYARAFVVDVETGRTTQIIDGPEPVYQLDFSFDGRRILFTRLRDHRLHLWAVSIHGGDPVLVLPNVAFGCDSPSGTKIAFRKSRYNGQDITQMTGGMWLVDIGTDDQRPLTNTASMSQIDPMRLWPVWSPSGARITFEVTIMGGIAVVDVQTGRTRRFGIGKNPSWFDNHTLIVEDWRRPR